MLLDNRAFLILFEVECSGYVFLQLKGGIPRKFRNWSYPEIEKFKSIDKFTLGRYGFFTLKEKNNLFALTLSLKNASGYFPNNYCFQKLASYVKK